MKLAISISGGGALGIGPLQFMRRLEADLGVHLADYGSAFAGTSTGSIVAAGLCTGFTASQLYDLYKDNLSAIFTKVSAAKILTTNYYRYDNSKLKKKVWDRGDGMSDQWFAVLSSCSAPTYFDVVSRNKDGKKEIYCDGGMWANDPIMVLESGLNKAKEFKGDYKILSFNTGMLRPNNAPKDKSVIGWGKYILEEWVARTGNSGYYEARANLGEKNVCRVAPSVDSKFAMDDLSIVGKVSDIWDELYENIGAEVRKFVKSTVAGTKITPDK